MVIFNDQDQPWFGEKIKVKIELKNRFYKEYIKNGRPEAVYYLIQNLTSEILLIYQNAKIITLYVLEKKLGDSSRSIKSYCATL